MMHYTQRNVVIYLHYTFHSIRHLPRQMLSEVHVYSYNTNWYFQKKNITLNKNPKFISKDVILLPVIFYK